MMLKNNCSGDTHSAGRMALSSVGVLIPVEGGTVVGVGMLPDAICRSLRVEDNRGVSVAVICETETTPNHK
jgi:hypothetical protein